ncbi:unnamed protein product, partial [Amoebophrya sp. A120]
GRAAPSCDGPPRSWVSRRQRPRPRRTLNPQEGDGRHGQAPPGHPASRKVAELVNENDKKNDNKNILRSLLEKGVHSWRTFCKKSVLLEKGVMEAQLSRLREIEQIVIGWAHAPPGARLQAAHEDQRPAAHCP